MRYARIIDSVVAEVFETDGDIEKMFHPSLVWTECGNDVQTGWMYDGEGFAQPEPVEPEPYVPQQVTRAQGKAALVNAGYWNAILDYISNIGDETQKNLTEIALNDTSHWRRDSPSLVSCANALGLTEEDIDNLFIAAEKIKL